MRRIIGKNNRGGFTLAETLVAVLILVMVTGVVAAGIPAASDALTRASNAAHSQVLLSTTMTMIRDELATARQIEGTGGATSQSISYVDAYGAISTLYVDTDGIKLKKEAAPSSKEDNPGFDRLLVSQEAATKDLYVSFNGWAYDPATGIIQIDGLRVCKKTSADEEQVVSDLKDVAFKIEVIRKG